MRRNVFTGTCLLALCLLWGCRDSVGGIRQNVLAYQGQDVAVGEGSVPVQILLEGTAAARTITPAHVTQAGHYSAHESISGPLRTIAPAHITQTDLVDPSMYLLTMDGRSDIGDSVTVPNFTLSNGRGAVSLSPGVWTLTLTATDAVGNTAVLRGSTTVTVWSGRSAEARFTLTPVETGTGTVRLRVNWQEADRAFVQPTVAPYPSGLTVSMALYHPVTGQKATSYERLADGGNGTQSDTDAFFRRGFTGGNGGGTGNIATTFTYTGGTSGAKTYNVPAGMYTLKFTITGGNLSAGTALQWRDFLYVEAGRQTTGTITIPRLTDVPPSEPATFRAVCTPLTAAGTYTATLDWQDVYNASSYQLEVMRYSTGTTRPADDAAWAIAAGQPTSLVYRYTSVVGADDNYTNPGHSGVGVMDHLSGGLLGGQTEIAYRMTMASGQGFAARLRAVNPFGVSAWVYLAAPLVPNLPFFPTNLTAKVGEVLAGDVFKTAIGWTRGIVDANGTYELELLSFTGGTKPENDGSWNGGQTGRATYTFTSAAPSPAGSPAAISSGGMTPASDSVELTITGTGAYYTARLRAVNSSGSASDWLYLADPMIPSTVFTAAAPTQANYQTWGGSGMVWVWDVLMSIRGPNIGTNYRMEWLRLVKGTAAAVVDNDEEWDYLFSLPENQGSGARNIAVGASSENMRQMNNGSPFMFRIRTETPYGNSLWWYWPQEVRQLP